MEELPSKSHITVYIDVFHFLKCLAQACYSCVFLLCCRYPHYICFNSESEHAWLTSIHSTSSYDLKLIIADFLSGKMKRDTNWG